MLIVIAKRGSECSFIIAKIDSNANNFSDANTKYRRNASHRFEI